MLCVVLEQTVHPATISLQYVASCYQTVVDIPLQGRSERWLAAQCDWLKHESGLNKAN